MNVADVFETAGGGGRLVYVTGFLVRRCKAKGGRGEWSFVTVNLSRRNGTVLVKMRSICARVARWAKLISARRWNRRRRLIRALVSMLLLTLHRGEGYFYPHTVSHGFLHGGSFFENGRRFYFGNTNPKRGKGNLFSRPIFDWFIEIQLIYSKHSSSPYNLNIGFFFFFTLIVKQYARFIFYIYSGNFEIFFPRIF